MKTLRKYSLKLCFKLALLALEAIKRQSNTENQVDAINAAKREIIYTKMLFLGWKA